MRLPAHAPSMLPAVGEPGPGRGWRWWVVAVVALGVVPALPGMAATAWGADAPATEMARVTQVIDGDTVVLTDGRKVRYIGMDAPEMRRRVGRRWVRAPQPYGAAATAANRALVAGKRVRLEWGQQTRDKYGRWLAYVYVGNTAVEDAAVQDVAKDYMQMVNEILVGKGLARARAYAPNHRHQRRLAAAQAMAKKHRRGLWAHPSANQPTDGRVQ